MRLVLAVVTVATAFVMVVPVIATAGTLFACILFAGAALSLTHTGALTPAAFEAAHAYGVLGLGGFFLAALTYRLAQRNAKGLLGAMSRRPLLTAAIVLPPLSLLVVGAQWDRRDVPELAGALVITDLYFFSLGAMMLMVVITALVARGVYRWASARRYRAGLITGAQVTLLALVLSIASFAARSLSPPSPAQPVPALNGWQNASGLEAERQLFVGVDALLETRVATAIPAPSADDDIRACIEELMSESVQVRSNIGRRFRLSDGDAHDVVQDALLNVCNAHVRKRYTRLGAVLQRAAERRAINWAFRRARQCELDFSVPACEPLAEEMARFNQEDAVLNRAICEEDPITQQIIWLRVLEDLRFAEIGARLGLRENDARTKFNNALRRMRKRLGEACAP